MAVVENLQREDLNYFEEAECYKALLDELKLTQEELASRLGKARVSLQTNSVFSNFPLKFAKLSVFTG